MALGFNAWSSEDWVAYYGRNAAEPVEIPWDRGAELTEADRSAVAASMQGFQLGESSEGRHLIDRARAWSIQNDDPAYPDAIRLFIGEEGRHARDLGRFLDLNGIPRIEKAFSDSAFRHLRRAAGLEVSIAVLVTAEVIAQVYYAALRDATQSAILKALCERILRDEEEHVRFQAERMALLARGRSPFRLWMRRRTQRGLMLVTLLVVWTAHRHAYQAGGYPFARYARETLRALDRALDRMDPRAYRWSELAEAVQAL